MHPGRELWTRIETVHAVTYFASESIDAAKTAGLKGFWMGYFGFRAAPLGAVAPGVVEAAFANFAPAMVARALPDAWAYADPATLVDRRAEAAAAALRRIAPSLVDDTAHRCGEVLSAAAAAGSPLGRPLFGANLRLTPRTDAVEALWQIATTLREHRGDGHVAALLMHRVDGCEAHVLHAAAKGIPTEILQQNRGFSDADWAAAVTQLTGRGCLDDGRLTDAGTELVSSIETATDELALAPIESADIDLPAVLRLLDPLAKKVAASGVLPFPNPMGLPER